MKYYTTVHLQGVYILRGKEDMLEVIIEYDVQDLRTVYFGTDESLLLRHGAML